MEDSLVAKLDELDMADCVERLVELGVQKQRDLGFLREDDLKQAGLTLVQVRKLQSLAPRPTKQDSSRGPLDQILEAEDGQDEQPSLIDRSESSTNWMRISDDGQYMEVAPSTSMLRQRTALRRRNSEFWSRQMQGRPMKLIWVRHGESEANVDRTITSTVPDHMLHLTEEGRRQALEAGQRLRTLVGDRSVKFIVSPYVRTRETLNGMLRAWGDDTSMLHSVREDVRIREQEYGNFDDPDIKALHQEKRNFGAFYYRFPAGESPADCYDRASLFLESMYRSWNDNRSECQVVVCHGMMILVTLMRLMRLPIEEFDNLDSLKNCEFVVLERPEEDAKYSIAFTWSPGEPQDPRGLRRKPKADRPPIPVWDGDPDAPSLANKPVRS